MFMRYTHYGIGHPTVPRKMTRDCADAGLARSPELQEDEDEDWGNHGDLQPCESDSEKGGCDDDEGREVQEDADDDREEDFEQDDEDSSVNDSDEKEDGEDGDGDEEDDYVSF